MPDKIRAICLCGPTGAGKTALAVQLAKRLDAEIINADSRQLYRDFPLITAQPSSGERADIPHHLYGFMDTRQKPAAGEWQRLAAQTAAAVAARGRVPLFVGGSGFYFEALLRGLAAIPKIPAEVAKAVLERMAALGPALLHRELAALDPGYAARIHPHDRQRIARALEVWEATGRTFSWWHAQPGGGAPCRGPLLAIGVSRAELAPRLELRIGQMLAAGALEEAARAMRICPDKAAPGWNGIGCAELYDHLTGKTSLEECRALWLKNTLAYAKRQLTWFRGRGRATFISPASLDGALRAIGDYFPC